MARLWLIYTVFVLFTASPFAFAVSYRDTVTKLPGLKAAATITRDSNGIAHIRAKNAHDLFFLQGYVHAEDRLFQMDVSRRQASGTLAELLGLDALPSDVESRTIGLGRAAQRSLDAYSPRVRAALQAYADGVNTYVSDHLLPPEYAVLELTRFEPWTPLDSVTVIKLIAFGESFDAGDIERTQTLAAYTAAGFDAMVLFSEDLFRSAPFDPVSTVPDASEDFGASQPFQELDSEGRTEASAAALDARVLELCKRYLKKIHKVPLLRCIVDRDQARGSNQWVLSAPLSASGNPLIANDPHLALDAPSIFYPIHLQAPRFNVIGSGFAGLPFVVLGHNRFIAWGPTHNPMDVTDFFQEQVVPDPDSPSGLSTLYRGQKEPLLAIPEVFRANQIGDGEPDTLVTVPPSEAIPAFTLIVPRRNRGPIIEFDPVEGTALSVQYTGFSATLELQAFFEWNQAWHLGDFIRGLRFFDVGSENWAYADAWGNIAYFTSAEMPVREDLQAGSVVGLPPYFIRNGLGGNEWLPVQNPQPHQAVPYEILPFEEMPKLINPSVGYFINANNDPIGNTLDNNPLNELRPGGGIFYLNPRYASGFRAGRITQMLREKIEAKGVLSFEEMQAMQGDTVLLDGQVFVPYILAAFEHANAEDAHPALVALTEIPGLAEAVGRLGTWDYTTPTGIPEGYDASDENDELGEPSSDEIASSIAATLYSVWRSGFIANTIDAALMAHGLPEEARPDSARSLSALRNQLDNFETNQGVGASGLDFFQVPGIDDPAVRRDSKILESLVNALERLASNDFAAAFGGSTNQEDYRWGKLHRIVLESLLDEPFSIPPAGGAFPAPLDGLDGIPTDGGFNTVDLSIHKARGDGVNGFMFDSGPARRFVGEAYLWGIDAESSWPGGTSGVLGNERYVNLLPFWLSNDTVPLWYRNRDVRRNAASVARFIPEKSKGK